MTTNNYLSKIINSEHDENKTPDSAAQGALSRWLENENIRMRIMLYPSGFKSDHVCNKGHALYVISGNIKMYIGEDIAEWNEGDAFIIPDEIPHLVFNSEPEDAKVIVVDNN